MTAGRRLRSSNVPFEPPDLVNAAVWSLHRFAALGVRIPAGNRLQTAGRLVRQVIEGHVMIDQHDERALKRLADAQWSIVEQYTIARMVNPNGPLTATAKEKLAIMLGGADIEDDERNPIARNTQFEFYVGATFALGGMSFALEEPDLSFEYLGVHAGIAAKRVRSTSQLRRRVEEGIEQIARTGRPGFVAVNVDLILRQTAPVPGPGPSLDERLPVLRELEAVAGSAGILGLILLARTNTWNLALTRPKLEVASFNRVRIFPTTPHQKTEGEALFNGVLDRIERNQRAIWKREQKSPPIP